MPDKTLIERTFKGHSAPKSGRVTRLASTLREQWGAHLNSSCPNLEIRLTCCDVGRTFTARCKISLPCACSPRFITDVIQAVQTSGDCEAVQRWGSRGSRVVEHATACLRARRDPSSSMCLFAARSGSVQDCSSSAIIIWRRQRKRSIKTNVCSCLLELLACRLISGISQLDVTGSFVCRGNM